MRFHLKYFLCLLLLSGLIANGQVLIHSHNDYLRKRPFQEALEARVFSVEADIFYRDSLLVVAHSDFEIKRSNSIDKLYLEPLTNFCLEKKTTVSPDKYLPVMLVDIKEDLEKALPLLQSKLIAMQQRLKGQGVDTMPLFVISGERPPADSFGVYPYYIQFDGRPFEQYDSAALSKVAFISDQYLKYSSWLGNTEISIADSATISRLVQGVHGKGKKLRLWNTPDSPLAWSTFNRLGIDIINTDQPLKCYAYFKEAEQQTPH